MAPRYIRYLEEECRASFVLADSDPEVRARLNRGGRTCLSGLNEVVAEAACEAVLILTPPATHVDLALECADAGVSALVEKPPAIAVNDLERLSKLGGSTVHCMVPYRSTKAFRISSEMLADHGGASLRIRVNWPRHEQYFSKGWRRDYKLGGGPLWNTFFHQIDMALSLLHQGEGPLEVVVRKLSAREADFDVTMDRGHARLHLTTIPTFQVEELRLRVGARTIVASGRRFCESINVDGRVIHVASAAAVERDFISSSLSPLLGGDVRVPDAVKPAVALVEMIYDLCSRNLRIRSAM